MTWEWGETVQVHDRSFLTPYILHSVHSLGSLCSVTCQCCHDNKIHVCLRISLKMYSWHHSASTCLCLSPSLFSHTHARAHSKLDLWLLQMTVRNTLPQHLESCGVSRGAFSVSPRVLSEQPWAESPGWAGKAWKSPNQLSALCLQWVLALWRVASQLSQGACPQWPAKFHLQARGRTKQSEDKRGQTMDWDMQNKH